MGVFSFIKDAGRDVHKTTESINLLKHKDMDLKASQEDLAIHLGKTVKDFKLIVEHLHITLDEDMATVTGNAADQCTKEKVVLVIGNTKGIVSVDDQMTVDHVEPEAHYHTIIEGETLGQIAHQYYGNADDFNIVLEANKPMLTDANTIYTGQVLRIPNFRG